MLDTLVQSYNSNVVHKSKSRAIKDHKQKHSIPQKREKRKRKRRIKSKIEKFKSHEIMILPPKTLVIGLNDWSE